MLCSLRIPSTFHPTRSLSQLHRLVHPLASCTALLLPVLVPPSPTAPIPELAYQYANAHLVFSRLSLVPVVHAALKSLGYSESEIRARVVMVTSQWLTGGDTTNLVRLDAFFWMWGA